MTDEIVARPYYHTSKAQFELMASIVRHFSPDIPLSVPALREYVSTLKDTPSEGRASCAIPSQQLSPATSISQHNAVRSTWSASPARAASPVSEPSTALSEDNLSGIFISDATCQRRR